MKTVYMMAGIPGSGKSTWIKENGRGITISRDALRLTLLKDGEQYFTHEKTCYQHFINAIIAAIKDETVENIYIDATHLTVKSRKTVFSSLGDLASKVDKKIAVVGTAGLDTCLKRNAQRTGRALVPENSVRDMANNFQFPTEDEGFDMIITFE